MIKMIRITSEKRDEMSELAEKMLHYGGKLMTCLESLGDEGYGERMGMRDDEDWDDDDDDMGMRGGYRGGYGMRRGRSSRTGRYTRY